MAVVWRVVFPIKVVWVWWDEGGLTGGVAMGVVVWRCRYGCGGMGAIMGVVVWALWSGW